MKRLAIISIMLILTLHATAQGQVIDESQNLVVASKKFTENVTIGEIIRQLFESKKINVRYRQELGGTRVLWNGLQRGDIDIYPEYTGTLFKEIFGDTLGADMQKLKTALNNNGILMSAPLGFNNTYALGMLPQKATEFSISSISDLKQHPTLKFGFTNEFMDRSDGWPGLQHVYQLPQRNVTGLDHDIAYRGLQSEAIEVIDLYSTDAEIGYYGLSVLTDDKHYFPRYDCILLYRADMIDRIPGAEAIIQSLANKISESEMIAMNEKVKIDRQSTPKVAAEFIKKAIGIEVTVSGSGFWQRLKKNSMDHLFMVLISLFAAICIAIPLGVFAAKYQRLEKTVLGITGIIQTIPSLALLVFMIPLLGIGTAPAIVALFLYSLLPIVRNTHSGLKDIPGELIESAQALGLPSGYILRKIELPLAARSILSGIKTSAVINVGTATLGALIGAGGYGQPILTGIRLDDVGLILEGAVPAALLAISIQILFDFAENQFIPRGLKR